MRASSLYILCVSIAMLFITTFKLYSQTGTISGIIRDSISNETLPGVNIIIDTSAGGTTDKAGNYHFILPAGKHSLTFKYIGYSSQSITFSIKENESRQEDILLSPLSVELNTAVITASRYQQRLSDVTVSMEVLPASYIQSVNTYYIDRAINSVPGVDIIDGQANIRGGSGYTYGAGSRVMVMMDGLPILSGGVNDVKWNSLPVEIIKNVEIIKGASSALYGSSALNGVINLITATPGAKPSTSVELSTGMYLQPERKEMSWFWDNNPIMGNIKFSHLRNIGSVDFSISGNAVYDEGYRQDNELQDARLNVGLRYNPAKIKGLTTGFNSSFQLQSFTDFLIWVDADSGAYMQNPDAITPMHGIRINADPYIRYYDQHNGRHSLKTRYYRVENEFDEDPDKDNTADVYFGEYQYQNKLGNQLNFSFGFAASYTEGKTNLYGNHYGSTQAVYGQLDHKFFDRLSISLGLRWERYTLDRTDDESMPVFRAGVNYSAAQLSFIRASFGQGFRYPSMAEKYTATDLGGLKIFPNEILEPETGWSAEIGFKQGFNVKKWDGYIDIAAFWTEYNNMIDFIFGIYNPPGEVPTIDDLGFKSLNSGRARINGVDLTANVKAGLGPFLLKLTGGYTYMNPLDLSGDSTESSDNGKQILKYRYRHSAKGDFVLEYMVFDLGITAVYRSFMERIDPAFEEQILGQYFFPGLKEYRQENDQGAIILNMRIGWQISTSSKISFHINNLFNKEYMGRPGDIHAPRNINIQYLLNIN